MSFPAPRFFRLFRRLGCTAPSLAGLGCALALLSGVLDKTSSAQTPFTGVFTFGTTGNVDSFAYNGTPILNLTVGNLTKNGVTNSSSSQNFRASSWPQDTGSGTLSGVVDLNKFFQFTLTAAAGFTFDLSSLDFGAGRSGTGPRSFEWRSSADDYAAPISSYSTLNASVTNSSGVLTTPNANAGYTGNVLALSGSSPSFTGLESITLRFYGYNSGTSSGTGGLQGPLTFAGSLVGTTGAAYTWAGGAGNWQTGQNGAFGQAFANSSTATATFAGTGGTVTVSGTVEIATMTVDSTGYSFDGGAIALANAAITVNADSTTVSSVLEGSSGLLKNGTGSLMLSGANTFTGLANISAGRVIVGADSAFGNADNDISINGTLQTTAGVSLGSSRDLSGAGTLDIAPETSLTVNGNTSMSALTLANSGTLSLQGATRSVGTLTINSPLEVQAAGAISATGLTAPGLTAGTATITPDVVFTTGDKTVNVPGTGTLVLDGNISGLGTSRLAKTGAGTLEINGALGGGIRIGVAGSTDGGTVVLGQAASSGTTFQIQLNYGTLRTDAEGGLTMTPGLSIGGRDATRAVLGAGESMAFAGNVSFFASGAAAEMVLEVNNATTLSGSVALATGASVTGWTIRGAGELTLSGESPGLTAPITLADSLTLFVEGSTGNAVNVGANNTIGGAGTIGGNLALASGAQFLFDPLKTLTVNGSAVTFADFGISDLIGFSAAIPDGSYTLIDGLADIVTTNLRNFGLENAVDLGDGRKAYFSEGSLVLNVVPEPSAVVLAGLGGLLAAGYALRRRG